MGNHGSDRRLSPLSFVIMGSVLILFGLPLGLMFSAGERPWPLAVVTFALLIGLLMFFVGCLRYLKAWVARRKISSPR